MVAPFAVDTDILNWLLEKDDPAVRSATLTRLEGRPASDAEVQEARAAIMQMPPVSAILRKQQPDGHWLKPEQFYTGKYRGTVWQLLVLAELGADGSDPRIRKACSFILDVSLDRTHGGFSAEGGRNGGQPSVVIPCLTGNMVWALLRLGCEDARVKAGIDWITTYQRFDDGDVEAPKGWPYDRYQMCWGRHSCHLGVVKAIKALAEIPQSGRSREVSDCLGRAAEFMLIHHIHKRSHDLGKLSKPGWKKFGFPLMYQTDVLEVLNLLLDLGHRDERMAEAVALVEALRREDGRWLLENSYNKSMGVKVEQLGQPSKWITLNALWALKRWHAAA